MRAVPRQIVFSFENDAAVKDRGVAANHSTDKAADQPAQERAAAARERSAIVCRAGSCSRGGADAEAREHVNGNGMLEPDFENVFSPINSKAGPRSRRIGERKRRRRPGTIDGLRRRHRVAVELIIGGADESALGAKPNRFDGDRCAGRKLLDGVPGALASCGGRGEKYDNEHKRDEVLFSHVWSVDEAEG